MPEREWIGKLCQLTHASSLQQICDLAYEIMGNPVFISDMAHTILAYTKCVEVDGNDTSSGRTWSAIPSSRAGR